jgi:hypothetical protein
MRERYLSTYPPITIAILNITKDIIHRPAIINFVCIKLYAQGVKVIYCASIRLFMENQVGRLACQPDDLWYEM